MKLRFVRSVVVVVVVCGGRALFAAEKLWDSLPSAPGFLFLLGGTFRNLPIGRR